MPTSTAKKILIAESDATLRQSLATQMKLHLDFVAIQAESEEQALKLVQDYHFDIILMDTNLPNSDGRDLCRLMRRRGVKIPIILLSAFDTNADMILGLDSGASDYIIKPFPLGVLLARVRAQHRQFEVSDDATFVIGPYAFRPSTKILTHTETNKKIHLTERESAILKYLYRMGGRPAPLPVLLSEVWGYNTGVSTHALESHIYRLRKKIEPNPANVQILMTEPEGYRLA